MHSVTLHRSWSTWRDPSALADDFPAFRAFDLLPGAHTDGAGVPAIGAGEARRNHGIELIDNTSLGLEGFHGRIGLRLQFFLAEFRTLLECHARPMSFCR